MTTIHIINSTGSYQGDLVLAGIYGELIHKDGAPTPIFQVAPEFKQVSHLFGYLEHGKAPIGIHQTSAINVPDEMGDLMKAELMHTLGARWAKMYKNMAPGQDGMMSAMLAGEAASVSNGVRNHLISQGMRAYAVPVSVNVTSGEDAYLGESLEDVTANLQHGDVDIEKIEWAPTEEEAIDLGTQRLGSIETPIENSQEAITERSSGEDDEDDHDGAEDQHPASSAPWSNFHGAAISASGFLTVIARNEQEARMLADFKCHERYSETGAPLPKITYSEVTSIEERAAAPVERVTESYS